MNIFVEAFPIFYAIVPNDGGGTDGYGDDKGGESASGDGYYVFTLFMVLRGIFTENSMETNQIFGKIALLGSSEA